MLMRLDHGLGELVHRSCHTRGEHSPRRGQSVTAGGGAGEGATGVATRKGLLFFLSV